MKFNYPEGSTPLEPDELSQLIPIHITTQEQLNAWEEKNILVAQRWAIRQKEILSIMFIKKLHLHMFNKTWKWAGDFRKSEKNIGIEWPYISVKIKELCDDVHYQFDHTVYSNDEIAVRFHHRLVWIHAFPNGNGRHARLMADLLIMQKGAARFSWGMHRDLYRSGEARKLYIEALKFADVGNYEKLLVFARS